MAKVYRTIFEAPNSPLPQNFVAEIPSRFDKEGTLIHNARNQIRVFEVNGQAVNIKKYCFPPIVNRLLYSLGWRTPKAVATYQNALKILEKGFLTPKPYGYILERTNGILGYSYFVSQQVQDMNPFGYGEHPAELIEALAQLTVNLHQKGLLHIDYTPNNILYKKEEGKYVFSLVDINRFHFYNKTIPMGAVLTNLMKPFHDEQQLVQFVQVYARLRGLDETLCKKVLRRRHLRNAYDKFKRSLKKLPGAYLFLNKPLREKTTNSQ